MIQIENPDDIYEWDIDRLWNALQLLEPEQITQYANTLKKIKYGIQLNIPILYIIKQWNEQYPETKRISIKGYGKYNITDYYDEIDERTTLMRRIIFDTIEQGTTAPRN